MKLLILLFLLLSMLGKVSIMASSLRVVELFRYGSVQMQTDHVQLGNRSGLFLKLNQDGESRCIHINNSGSYAFESLSNAFAQPGKSLSFFTCNLRALAMRLKSPSRLLFSPTPRSGSKNDQQQDAILFEEIWQQVVENQEDILPSKILASGIWYIQQQKPERAAHIFQYGYQKQENPWLLELHQEAYSNTTPEAIENEIALTRLRIKNRYSRKNALALLIGVEDYKPNSGFQDLKTPLEDIKRLNQVLVEDYDYLPENIIKLPNATYQQILDGIQSLKQQSNANSNVLIYYGGHGVIDEDQEYFWIPGDANQSPRTWVYTDYILNKIRNIEALHTLVIVDSCFSGALNIQETRGVTEKGVQKLYAQKSRQLITSGGVEPVSDGGGGRNSVFAGNLLEILSSQPDNKPLSAQGLFAQLQPRVVGSSNQTPTLDRIINSDDQWGQFYFFKSGLAQSDNKVETARETTPEINSDLFPFSAPDEILDIIGGVGLQRSRNTITVPDLVEKQAIRSLGLHATLNLLKNNEPLQLQLKYLDGSKTIDDEITYNGKEHSISQFIHTTQLEIGYQTQKINKPDRISERGFNYYWKRIRLEWDTSDIPSNKGGSEFANIGCHILNYSFFEAIPVSETVNAGFLNNIGVGFINFTGNTQLARKDKYNTDVTNMLFSFRSGPEIRYSNFDSHFTAKFGANFEYNWQPVDDKGGSASADNTLNASHNTSQVYAVIGITF